MIAVLREDGKMATIAPHGPLFRGGEEKNIRQGIIEDGLIEAIIGLPQNLFFGTGIPACCIVINKEGRKDRKHILFINADHEYQSGKNQNKLRPEDIQKSPMCIAISWRLRNTLVLSLLKRFENMITI